MYNNEVRILDIQKYTDVLTAISKTVIYVKTIQKVTLGKMPIFHYKLVEYMQTHSFAKQ